jgi:hypothetical protein
VVTEGTVLTKGDLRGRPVSGGVADARRSRLVKEFYARLPDPRVVYLDITEERLLDVTLNRQQPLIERTVPESRVWIIDSIEFFSLYRADLPSEYRLVPPGWLEPFIHCYFTIDNVVPLHLETRRQVPNLPTAPQPESYFPFLYERVGATEVTFSIFATADQEIRCYYEVIRTPLPVPALLSMGARIRGWESDVTIFREILEQQR